MCFDFVFVCVMVSMASCIAIRIIKRTKFGPGGIRNFFCLNVLNQHDEGAGSVFFKLIFVLCMNGNWMLLPADEGLWLGTKEGM